MPITGIKNVDFTLDGNSLLAWSDDRSSMYSHFWATKDLGDGRLNDRRGSLHKVSLGRCYVHLYAKILATEPSRISG